MKNEQLEWENKNLMKEVKRMEETWGNQARSIDSDLMEAIDKLVELSHRQLKNSDHVLLAKARDILFNIHDTLMRIKTEDAPLVPKVKKVYVSRIENGVKNISMEYRTCN